MNQSGTYTDSISVDIPMQPFGASSEQVIHSSIDSLPPPNSAHREPENESNFKTEQQPAEKSASRSSVHQQSKSEDDQINHISYEDQNP